MTTDELKERFRKFSIKIIKLVNIMPNNIAGNAIAKQIVRSGTSPAANYRAACLAKSNRDFLNKLKMVEEEIDETAHWLSVIIDAELLPSSQVEALYEECVELRKIVTRSILTVKQTIDAKERQ
ncbi:MAG: four helix bundle protein [Paludibacteraceae bacterium]|nr:four helix bundle protein [Paludibacteraceae bacterium]